MHVRNTAGKNRKCGRETRGYRDLSADWLPVTGVLKDSLQPRRQAATDVVGRAVVLEAPQLLLDGRWSGQAASDISQNPRQRAELRYGGLQEGIFTLWSPCVRLCLFVDGLNGSTKMRWWWWWGST